MKIKSFFSIIACKFSKKILSLLNKGSNLPGIIALKFDKNILETVSKNYKTIMVTGTNGKTTTCSMITNILKFSNQKVIANETGANMLTGIICCFIDNFKFNDKDEKWAVLEVDEAYLHLITEKIKPHIIAVTNIFRDQLDRYGEVYTTYDKIIKGISNSPNSTLILNGDCSILGGLDLPNNKVYYGFNTSKNQNKKLQNNTDIKFCKFCKSEYEYNLITFDCLGDFYCPNCDYKREELKYHIDEIIEITDKTSTVKINEGTITISQSGIYNIYNGLCAYSVAKELNLSLDISKGLSNYNPSFGRGDIFELKDNKTATMILVKNPAGYNQAVNTLTNQKENYDCLFLLNDRYADGTDVSWIWDVEFEIINKTPINKIFIGGTRAYDMAIRLKTANLNTDNICVETDFEKLTEMLVNSPSNKVYILTTYTAMLDYRKHLNSKGIIKNMWKNN